VAAVEEALAKLAQQLEDGLNLHAQQIQAQFDQHQTAIDTTSEELGVQHGQLSEVNLRISEQLKTH
jgi:hypothetical protein